MINWFFDIKHYFFFAMILVLSGWNIAQHFDNNHLEHAYQDALSTNAAMQLSIDEAQNNYKKQLSDLNKREQEAKKHAIESQQCATEIMKAKIPTDCHAAIRWMIDARSNF